VKAGPSGQPRSGVALTAAPSGASWRGLRGRKIAGHGGATTSATCIPIGSLSLMQASCCRGTCRLTAAARFASSSRVM
jgi:hypothetical protein